MLRAAKEQFKTATNKTDETHQDLPPRLEALDLKGNPLERPTADQILSHAFLTPGGPLAKMPMRYFGFLSHMQADASGVVGTLYLLLKRLGLHCWLDMREENLTLEGMRQGVRDSSVFTLILTEHVLVYASREEVNPQEAEELFSPPVQQVLLAEKHHLSSPQPAERDAQSHLDPPPRLLG